jgi:hypothetical protein
MAGNRDYQALGEGRYVKTYRWSEVLHAHVEWDRYLLVVTRIIKDGVKNNVCLVISTLRVVMRWRTSFLAGLLELSEVRTIGLTFGGCTWQWWLPSHPLVEGIVWRLDLLRDENPRSNHAG